MRRELWGLNTEMITTDRIAEPREERSDRRLLYGTSEKIWRIDLFWEFVSQDDLNESECFEDFMAKVDESGLEGLLWKSSIISIATKAWDENWSKYY